METREVRKPKYCEYCGARSSGPACDTIVEQADARGHLLGVIVRDPELVTIYYDQYAVPHSVEEVENILRAHYRKQFMRSHG